MADSLESSIGETTVSSNEVTSKKKNTILL